ncbi:hypothetical protein JI735_05730 [Paenibacillus sonchi]|uniref:Uncharacterized protein n=1 Tax=Paenibacillus sonchi TaxID=373687 RepID=A0A974SD62_9BACL|nr:hypothetical protein [Paenibacillus sonchi]QQZ62143.1 hypothetical protein JI735_05730 [Paenibacillus sonchi]
MNRILDRSKGKLTLVLFSLFSFVLIFIALSHPPTITGDGREYLGMTISFKNHLSFELTQADIHERNVIEQMNNIKFPDGSEYIGYYESLKGKFFSYHFWMYSLVNVIPFYILSVLKLNVLNSFQVTNTILFLLLTFKIIKSGIFKTKSVKFFVLTISLFSPIVLYLNWSNPEVYSYVLTFLGFIYYKENKIKTSMLSFSLAALQNPALSILAIYLLVKEFIVKRKTIFRDKKEIKSYLLLGIISSINIIPYIFYYWYFHKFNLITYAGFSSFEFFSIDKIWSLFFDLNFGIIVYFPVVLLMFIYLCFKKDENALQIAILLLLISIINSTQLNWNSGMMYINRYSVWYLPIILFACYTFINSLNKNMLRSIAIVYLLTTGLVTSYCLREYDFRNYMEFSPLAKIVISNIPEIYNPNPEIFVERVQGFEGLEQSSFPMKVLNSEGEVRKEIVRDESSGLMGYINGKTKLSFDNDLYSLHAFKKNQDIFLNDIEASFGEGWNDLENGSSDKKFRWIGPKANLLLIGQDSERKFSFKIQSYNKARNVTIILNKKKLYNGDVPEDRKIEIALMGNFSAENNNLEIISNNGSDKPSQLNGSPDNRDLSFSISEFNLE